MRKYLSLMLCLLSLLALSVPALAAEDAPPGWLFPGWEAPPEEEEASGESPPDWLYSNYEAPSADGSSEPDQASEPDPEQPPSESAGENDETNAPGNPTDHDAAPVAPDPSDGYPVGSVITPSGQVWSPSGEVLSPQSPEAEAADEILSSSLDVLDRADGGDQVAVTPGTAYIADLRPKDAPTEALDGLKALVASIFGEYTPITTTSVVTQTVGEDTYQYLVETVAPGSAGVDYEWIAGVLLFGILLFCLMRLLGGVLK